MATAWEQRQADMKARLQANRASDTELNKRFGAGYAAANPATQPAKAPSASVQDIIGTPKYDPSKYRTMDDYVKAVNANTANYGIASSGAISNQSTGQVVGQEFYNRQPNRVTTIGAIATPQAAILPTGGMPTGGTPPPQTDYAALAAARTAAALAEKRRIAEQQKGSLERSYGRANEITQGNRALENFRIDQTLSPFSGRTSFTKGIIGRERTLADESAQSNLLAQKANIDQLLADYENATAEEQVRIADELMRADRDYQLNLAQLSGNLPGGGQTLAARTADQNYGLNLAGLSGQLPGGGQTLQAQQLERSNFESDRQFEMAKSSQDWNQMMTQQQFDFNKASTLWNQNFQDKNFQQSVNQFAQQMNLNWTQLNNQEQAQIADMAFKQKQFEHTVSENNISRDLEIYSKTGQAPASLANYGVDVNALNDPTVKEDVNTMYSMLASGTQPKDILKTIDDKVKIGVESAEDGQKLKDAVYALYPDLHPDAPKEPNAFVDSFKAVWRLKTQGLPEQ